MVESTLTTLFLFPQILQINADVNQLIIINKISINHRNLWKNTFLSGLMAYRFIYKKE